MSEPVPDPRDESGKAHWREAGLAAMTGIFTFADVRGAIARAEHGGWQDGMYRFADRLLQSERRAGRIRTTPGNKRKWEALPTPNEEVE